VPRTLLSYCGRWRVPSRCTAYAAVARGRTGGRRPKLDDRQAGTVRRMYAAAGPDGKRQHTVAEIAAAVGVHRTTVYGYLKKDS
jgi:DNA invertase Pin-like site-specific DNA recombinase